MKKINTLVDYQKDIRNKKIFVVVMQILIFVSFIVIWQLLADLKLIDTFLVSSPLQIGELLIYYFSNNLIIHHISTSVIETSLGLIIGTTLGFISATIIYLFPLLNKILEPYLILLNSLPKTALAPIIIIWMGTNIKGIIAVAVSLSLIISIISFLSYFNNVDKNLIKMMKALKANKLQVLFKIIYPSNIMNIISVIKVNIGMTWVGVIVGEFLVSREGIGYLLLYGGQVFKLDLVMMGIFILAIIALIMYLIVNIIEKIIYKKINKKHQ